MVPPEAARLAVDLQNIQHSPNYRMAEWEGTRRHEGFTVLQSNDLARNMRAVAAHQDAGNILWHALAYPVHGAGLPDFTSPDIGLRAGHLEKGHAVTFIHARITRFKPHLPPHIYLVSGDDSQRQEWSPRLGGPDDEWGKLSMLRCLATNEPDAGPPKDPYSCSIFQLISDFYRQEVLVFYNYRGLLGPRAGFEHHYSCFVFGKQAYGTDVNFYNPCHNPGQLMLATDEDFKHFDAVTFANSPPGTIFGTSKWDINERYGWIRAPFTDPPGANPPIIVSLTNVPSGENGVPVGKPGAFFLAPGEPFIVCFENDRNAVETRPGFGNCRMPRLANKLTMGAWLTEVSAG